MATSLELAITAVRSGRKEEGRQLLNLLIQQNPNNEMAWLWMSSVVNNDEQRARCLYHVLAINPNNELARRGLQLLGIVVSDSRPVRVPRDSQPIPIQKPQPEVSLPDSLLNPATLPAQPPPSQPPTQPVQQPVAPAPPSQPAPEAERRPFRLDPKTITQELPFTPLREPFAETMRRSPSAFVPRADVNPPSPNATPSGQPPVSAPGSPPLVSSVPVADTPQPGQNNALPNPSEPVPVVPAATIAPGGLSGSGPGPSESVPLASGSVPVTDTDPLLNPAPGEQNAVAPTGQASQVPPVSAQSPLGSGPMSLQETRPSPPIWTTHSNVTTAMPQPAPPSPAPYPAQGINSNVTMSMPTPYPQPQPPPAIHSNATMGMAPPMPTGQPMPAEAMAALHSTATMGMPAYPPSPFPAPFPQNQVFHSSATMAMPTMTEAEARAHLLASQALAANLDPMAALRAAAASAEINARRPKSAKKGAREDEDEEEEEVNLMAVIVFGSLSVTALGGLGMLILLWFTSV